MVTRKHQRLFSRRDVSGEQEYQDEFNQELVSTGMNLAENLNRGNVHLVAAYPVAPINMAIDLPEFNTSGYENGISWPTPHQYEILASKIWH